MDKQKLPRKKKNLLVRLLAFLVTLALILSAVYVIVNRDLLNLDSLKRYFTYKSLERNDSGQAQSFSYSGSSTDVISAFGEDLLVCSAGGVRLYSGSGTCYIEDPVILKAPAAEVCGSTAAVYSVGGKEIYLYRNRTQYKVLSDLEGEIISVRLNSTGWLAVTARESGYKAVITVFDDEMNKRMAFRLSSAFVTDAVVTEDCLSLATISLGQKGSSLESTLSFYTLPDDQKSGVDYDLVPASTFSLGNNMVIDLAGGEAIRCVGDNGVSVWAGNDVTNWSCLGQFLKSYSIGDRFAAMLVGKYRSGSQAELYTIDNEGNPSIGRVINEQVLSVSAAGKYVAVLTANRLDIYTQDLDTYATLEGTNSARKVLLREDGSALLIGNGTAHLYVP